MNIAPNTLDEALLDDEQRSRLVATGLFSFFAWLRGSYSHKRYVAKHQGANRRQRRAMAALARRKVAAA